MREAADRGRFLAARDGFGFIQPADGGAELFVPPGETGGALHEDEVGYRLRRPARGEIKAEATVIEIIAHGIGQLTGVIGGTRRHPHLIPDHPRLPPRLRLLGPLGASEPGQRVLCRLEDAGGRRGPGAFLETILGDADDPRLDTEMIRVEFGLPGPYPDEARVEAEAAATAPGAPGDPADSGPPPLGRRDFTREPTVTIDPEEAGDFDDAFGLLALPEGGWRLRVHIADVSSTVVPGGALDREARRRGNSTYLPGTMIPMLPERLASDAMSLMPDQDRRVLTVSARIDHDGALAATRIDVGLIRSDARLAYEEVAGLLAGSGVLREPLGGLLREADRLAQRLRGRRLARGSFDLEVPEREVRLDQRGRTLEILRRRGGRSHQIVEEFMILANRVACRFARSRRQPYLYRVHGAPDPVGLERFRTGALEIMPGAAAAIRGSLPQLRRWLGSLPSTPSTWLVHRLFLRSLKRAIYAPVDTGHFGLGMKGYGHFTSPIRRYPDLINHRIVHWALRHGERPIPDHWRSDLAAAAAHCSATEELSERAEEMLIRVKCLRWAAERLGHSYRGRIATQTRNGPVIELDEVPLGGLVPAGDLEVPRGDRRRRSHRCRRAGELRLGMPVIVQVARVAMRERQLLFALRAVGRQAEALDPATLEAWADPWGPAPENARGHKGRSPRQTGRVPRAGEGEGRRGKAPRRNLRGKRHSGGGRRARG
ncbi:MAG: RNB domain-containing ribonuclease [Candidatus Eisenbacteria sp.]|nr:RNB domain-containing ribonuclease [Candidatus Eisenbacteria bacterium]